MPINFPNSAATNDKYTYNGRTWKYNGVGWESIASSLSLADSATNVVISTTDGNTSDTTLYPVVVGAASTGSQVPHIDSTLTYNAATETLSVNGSISTPHILIDSVYSVDTTLTTITAVTATAINTDTVAYSTNEYTVQAKQTKTNAITAVTASSPAVGSATYTSTAHKFVVGDSVVITGASVAGYNGTFTITAVAANTFTVANATTGAATFTSGLGTVTAYRSSKIMLVCNGTTGTSFTEYAILENASNSIPVTFTATATSGIVTLSGAFSGWKTGNNITVRVVRQGIV